MWYQSTAPWRVEKMENPLSPHNLFFFLSAGILCGLPWKFIQMFKFRKRLWTRTKSILYLLSMKMWAVDCTAWPYSDRINYQNDKYSHSRFQILHQHCSTQLIFSSLDLKGPLESPNSVISVSQMNFVAPFSPHHQLKYLCNKTNLNVKQVWYFTPPPPPAITPPLSLFF